MKELLFGIADLVQAKLRDLPEGFAGHEEIGRGASGSATSRIDKFAEDAILEHLKKNNIWLNVLSEEAGAIDLKADSTLVVDPIDGTANFNAGIPFYAVSLAIGSSKMSDVTHGLVRNLVNGDTFYAERGKGAFLNGKRIRTRSFRRSEALFFAYVGTKTDPATWKVVEIPRRVRSLGCASLEMCFVAGGRADGFYFNCDDFSKRMRIVDIAASALILREAGGEVYDLRGKALDVNFSLDDKVNFIALGDKSTKELIL
jgi:fructose-1,6-bisphosphatase/inositol monophosphatase family enzyme